MTIIYEDNNAESKGSFNKAIEKRANNKSSLTDRSKYQISKNNIKNGFSSKRFIIYGENKKEFERYREERLDYLDPTNPIQVEMCFHLIRAGWNLRRINTIRTGLLNIEIKNTLENSYNYEDVHKNDTKEIKNIFKEVPDTNEVLGIVFSRDCIGSNTIAKLTSIENSLHTLFYKIKREYMLDRFGKEYDYEE
jgi:hypothetical protein